jgi:hypothetical protein
VVKVIPADFFTQSGPSCPVCTTQVLPAIWENEVMPVSACAITPTGLFW